MNIDVHWHHTPPELLDAIRAGTCPFEGTLEEKGTERAVALDSGFRLPLEDAMTDADAAIEAMNVAGLDAAAISFAPPLNHHEADPETGLAVSRLVNDCFAGLKDSYAGRMFPLANVPLQDPEAAGIELRRCREDLGLFGVAIGTNVRGEDLGKPQFRPFWRAVADTNSFVFLHPAPHGCIGVNHRLSHPLRMNFVGLPIDSAAAVASLMFDGVYEEVGPLKTCFAHGGGAFPYIVSRWEHGYQQRMASRGTTVKNPISYLESVYCDSLTHSPAALRFLIEVVGADHVMLGSDFPHDMGDPQPLRTMLAAVEDEGAREAIAGKTAERLLLGD